MSRGTPFPGVPGPARWGGYLYAVHFDNDTVKVGCTANPGHRIATHRANAEAFGVAIVNKWVSPLHDTHTKTEKQLVALAGRLSDGQRLSEYFVGVDFDALVGQAALLHFPPVDVGAYEAAESRTLAVRREMTKTLIQRQWPEQDEPWNSVAHRLIGGLLGRREDGSYSHPVRRDGPEDPELPTLLQRIADLRGISVEDVRAMTFVDVLRSTLEDILRSEALELEIWACQTGREDLLGPFWGVPEPVDPPAA